MEQRNDLFLGSRLKIDQQVTAADQVQAGKGRVTEQVVGRKNHHLAQFGADPEQVTPLLLEKTLQPFPADVGQPFPFIYSVGGNIQGRPVHIGGKDIDFAQETDILGPFRKQNRQ